VVVILAAFASPGEKSSPRCSQLRQEWETAYQGHLAASRQAAESGQFAGTPETRRLNEAMRVARKERESLGCDPPVYEQ
jgi:hypothetical protein